MPDSFECKVRVVTSLASKAVTHNAAPSLRTHTSQTLTVEGLSCEHCEQSVEDALETVDGVQSVEVDREAERAAVEGDADPQALVSAVEAAGYDAVA